ncbi:hypothetical protein AB4Z54_60855, partial [Streptomyces sp. MCAF7]
PYSDDKRAVRCAFADELTNRFPPYAVHSGVYDVLVESDGDVLAVDGESARAASLEEAVNQIAGLFSVDLQIS